MSLPINTASFNEMMTKVPQEKIARAVIVLLLGYITYLCAQFTWMIAPQQNSALVDNVRSTDSKNQNKASQINLDAIKALNIFGQHNQKAPVKKVEVQDAPQTKLRLTLSGVVASDIDEIAAAVIENNGKQETYGVGDTIDGTRAVLEKVFNDRVLIKQSGRVETLMLDGFKYSKNVSTPKRIEKSTVKSNNRNKNNVASNRVLDQRNNRNLTNSARQLKEDFAQDPGKITDYLKISPKRVAGRIVGYQLMPGKNAEFFKISGLKSGDVATQMNGLDLTNPAQAAQALQALRQESEVSLLLDRNGEMTEILFSINE